MIIAIDTETYEYDQKEDLYKPVLNTNKFVIGCVKTDTRKKPLFFLKSEDMYNWIINTIKKNKEKGRATYIYAHNTEYDWYAIAKNKLTQTNIKYILFTPFLAILEEKGYITDTMSFYRSSLKEVGKLIKKEKLEMPTQIKRIEDLKEYVQRDTEITLESILHIKNILKKLGFKPRKLLTAGQVSMTCFLTYCKRNGTDRLFTIYNEEKKRKEVVKTKYNNLIREAYRGGDNQAHQLGRFEKATLIDINGHYAEIMRTMKFIDLKSENMQIKPNKTMFKKYLERQLGVARVIITAPTTQHPILPIRFGKYEIFPSNTKMRGTWTFAEIKQAITEGYKLEEVEWCVRYNELKVNGESINPFKPFIEELYKIERETTNNTEKAIIKMIRNNLSGKWAQNRKTKDYRIIPRWKATELLEQGYTTKSKFDENYVMVKETQDYEPSFVNPIISIYITALGRLKLHEEEKKIPTEKRLYKDTDGLLFIDDNQEIIKKFKIGKELGEWKIEELQQPCKILGEKRYYIGKTVKFSGLHKDMKSVEVLEKEENIKVKKMYGISSAYEYGNWDEVGTFKEIEMELKPHNKKSLITPEYIDECKTELEEKK